MSDRWDERRKARARIGIPQPEWGDNVVSADFSRGRKTAKKPGRSGQTGATSPVKRTDESAAASAGTSAAHTKDAEQPRSTKDGWAAEEIMRTATAQADAARLSRGRTYFRGGHASRLDYELGRVDALVSGTQLEPFEVQIRWRPLTQRQIDFVIGECGDQPDNVRRLLAGMRPTSTVASVLFGVEHYMDSFCTCPDLAEFCKHRVCVAYALAARFAKDPREFLAWRGIDVEELLAATGGSLGSPNGWPEETGGREDGPEAGVGATGTGVSGRVERSGDGEGDGEAGDQAGESAGEATAEQPEDTTTYSPTEFWGDPDALPSWGSLDMEIGLDLGDTQARDRALRKFSWNNADQLRVLDTLTRCYEALTALDDPSEPYGQDGPRGADGRVFEREPWMSGPDDRSGNHD
ncbi:SWIM zinc finger family protein [Corynebacterium sp. AOP40-9SA-29]|uniref:SWIM zinc finger family protein n=1 Tax=Corynebacterium sp. AOP40-9SA-29 TaxID=3457677 RepID=UPI0040342A03